MDAITVYTNPPAMQFNATFRALDRVGIEYTVVGISENPTSHETYGFWRKYRSSCGQRPNALVDKESH